MQYYYIYNGQKTTIGYSHDTWAFFLMINKIPSLVEWKKHFAKPGSLIQDLDDYIISPDLMEMIITVRTGIENSLRSNINWHRSKVFAGTHTLAHIMPGHCVGGVRCIANEDCWDLCVPE